MENEKIFGMGAEARAQMVSIFGADKIKADRDPVCHTPGDHISAVFTSHGLVVSARDEVCAYYIVNDHDEEVVDCIGLVREGSMRHYCFPPFTKDGTYVFGILDWSLIVTVENLKAVSYCESPYPEEFRSPEKQLGKL